VKALEEQVAEMESEMAKKGITDSGNDHWQPQHVVTQVTVWQETRSQAFQFLYNEPGNPSLVSKGKRGVSLAVRDLMIESHGFYYWSVFLSCSG
jgi:hypothetical protein